MQTLLVFFGYVVYFIFIMVYVSHTCDVNEYLSNENYKKAVWNSIDTPILSGLAIAVVLCIVL